MKYYIDNIWYLVEERKKLNYKYVFILKVWKISGDDISVNEWLGGWEKKIKDWYGSDNREH